jgi:hypothetical protein
MAGAKNTQPKIIIKRPDPLGALGAQMMEAVKSFMLIQEIRIRSWERRVIALMLQN